MAGNSPDASPCNEFMDENHSFLDMELEALQSIYINELEVKVDETFTTISIDLYPSTADKLDEQYVRMTLQFILEEEYPYKIPEIKIRNPRGLSDDKLDSIIDDLYVIADGKKGNSMLFEMIDAAKEHLTVGNRPSGECAICLYGFSDKDVFTKTECYHYFHSHCLARYAKNFFENATDNENDSESKSGSTELLCPMCRIPIQFSGYDAKYPPPEESDESSFTLTEEIVELQKKMADLFQKQVEKGGIIDIEAEKNKYLLEISNVPTRVNNEDSLEQKIVSEDDSTPDKVGQDEEPDLLPDEKREHIRDHHNQKFDYRGKSRNFNRPNDNRNSSRTDYRYNKQSRDNYRGNFNKSRYGKQNSHYSHRNREESREENSLERTKDSSMPEDSVKTEDWASCQDALDDVSETSDHPSPNSRNKYQSNFSPRYNRGYRHRGNNYGNYHNNSRRSDKSSYHEHHNSQMPRRYSAMHGEESSPSKSEERVDDDQKAYDDHKAYEDRRTYEDRRSYDDRRTYEDRKAYDDRRTYDDRKTYDERRTYDDRRSYDDINHKGSHRSGNYKRDDDYHTRHRYSDNRNNSQRGYKGAYGRRDNYSSSHNNYTRNNRYPDSKDREQYPERNYREKRTYADKYRPNEDFAYNRYKQGAKNYTGSRPNRYSDRCHTETNYEAESVQLNSENQNDECNVLPVQDESVAGSNHYENSSERDDDSQQKKSEADLDEKESGKLTDAISTFDGSVPNSFPKVISENSRVIPRTVNPPPGFANPLKKVIYGLQGANPPPGFNRS